MSIDFTDAPGIAAEITKRRAERQEAEIRSLREQVARARLEGAEIAREAAARVCKDQRAAFADPAYAGSSRMAAFEERFACGECLTGIESLDLPAILAGA